MSIYLIEAAEVSIATPALLFSASAFLLLAFTNRYLTIAARIRSLCEEYDKNPKENLRLQIMMLDKRVDFLRFMQLIIIASFFTGVLSMFLLFLNQNIAGVIVFCISLMLLCASLLFTIYEINISSRAHKLHIKENIYNESVVVERGELV